MALDPLLLEILACPQDKGPLLYFRDEDALYNPRLRRRYSITDGIPDMLIDDAEDVEGAEHDRLTSKARAEGIRPNFEAAAGQEP
jgi:uncharacterized protein YbaR (Trm112 family)